VKVAKFVAKSFIGVRGVSTCRIPNQAEEDGGQVLRGGGGEPGAGDGGVLRAGHADEGRGRVRDESRRAGGADEHPRGRVRQYVMSVGDSHAVLVVWMNTHEE
jgi:hypothetical protein